MNAIAEPIELLEAECNAPAWVDRDDDVDAAIDEACGERVLDWTVQRICAVQFPPAAA
jgi:hypothetical protein